LKSIIMLVVALAMAIALGGCTTTQKAAGVGALAGAVVGGATTGRAWPLRRRP
jgi:hypothetical protein